jgi:hypothetical protein
VFCEFCVQRRIFTGSLRRESSQAHFLSSKSAGVPGTKRRLE